MARSTVPAEFFQPEMDKTVFDGYKVQRDILVGFYNSATSPIQETGFSSGNVIPLTLNKPLSRGSINIESTDPFGAPLIDWGALTNPVDLDIMVAAMNNQRKFMATDAMYAFGPLETAPGGKHITDNQLRKVLREQMQPTYSHLTSTCSMMKKQYGGVVGPDLLVYDVQGLSVVDASIIPLIPAAHTSSTVYAVAEKV